MWKSGIAVLLAFACGAFGVHVQAQPAYPDAPVKMIVVSPPGGSADLMARVVAQKLSELWKQPVNIDNRAGGGGSIGMEYLTRQPADGLTFVLSNMGPIAVESVLLKTRYDPDKDFAPVTMLGVAPSLLVVNGDAPYKTLAELVAAARASPRTLSYGSGGPGALSRLGMEIWSREAGIGILNVPYNGGIASLNALMGHQTTMVLADIQPGTPLIRSGKLRALAVTSPERSPSFPDVPTIAEAGFPGSVALNSWGFYVVAGTPPAILQQLNASLRKALAEPDVAKKFAEFGVRPTPGTPAELKAFMDGEAVKYRKVIGDMGLKRE